MHRILVLLFIISLFFSCSSRKQVVYLDDIKKASIDKINSYNENPIQIGDILRINISTIISEVSDPYSNQNQNQNLNSNTAILDGYLVNNDSLINYPILGNIKVVGYTEQTLASKIKDLLYEGGHLTNPHVMVKKINSKFTVLGEVKNPGTFTNFNSQLNIFQALGTSGDLLITAKKNNVKLIRQENGVRKIYNFSLNNSEIFDKPFYYVKNNDIIIIEPNFSKTKSAGFIGSPSSIASISSLLLSITLLLINK